MLRDVMGDIELARHLQHQEPGGGARHATAARVSYMTRRPASHHESADAYSDIVARLGAMTARAITEALAKATLHDLRAARPMRRATADILKLEGIEQ